MESIKKEYYEIESVIGKGSFGKVFLARNKKTTERVALKIVKLEKKNDILNPGTEIKGLYEVREKSKHLTRILRNFISDKKRYIELELCEGLCLHNLINFMESYSVPLTEESFVYISKQVVQGLHHIHSCGYIHRDLKPENILFTKDFIFKISDFGGIIKEEEADHGRFGNEKYYPEWDKRPARQSDDVKAYIKIMLELKDLLTAGYSHKFGFLLDSLKVLMGEETQASQVKTLLDEFTEENPKCLHTFWKRYYHEINNCFDLSKFYSALNKVKSPIIDFVPKLMEFGFYFYNLGFKWAYSFLDAFVATVLSAINNGEATYFKKICNIRKFVLNLRCKIKSNLSALTARQQSIYLNYRKNQSSSTFFFNQTTSHAYAVFQETVHFIGYLIKNNKKISSDEVFLSYLKILFEFLRKTTNDIFWLQRRIKINSTRSDFTIKRFSPHFWAMILKSSKDMVFRLIEDCRCFISGLNDWWRTAINIIESNKISVLSAFIKNRIFL